MIDAVRVFTFFTGMTVERAEDAIDVADVGVVRIRIDDECDLLFRIFPVADRVRQIAEIEKFGILQKKKSFFGN